MTDRLVRAIAAAYQEAYGYTPNNLQEMQRPRTFARALIADILKPDPPHEYAFEQWLSFNWGSEAAIYQIRKRADLLTPEELAQEAEWEQSP